MKFDRTAYMRAYYIAHAQEQRARAVARHRLRWARWLLANLDWSAP